MTLDPHLAHVSYIKYVVVLNYDCGVTYDVTADLRGTLYLLKKKCFLAVALTCCHIIHPVSFISSHTYSNVGEEKCKDTPKDC